jgi:hypothetical protein
MWAIRENITHVSYSNVNYLLQPRTGANEKWHGKNFSTSKEMRSEKIL